MKRAVFIDRDGTINEEAGYLSSKEELVVIESAYEAVKKLNENGFLVVIITNQSGIAKGYFDEETLEEINNEIVSLLKKRGAFINDVLYCPHHKDALIERYKTECDCRKPSPGMLYEAKNKYSINLKESFVIGDKISDVELAKYLRHGILVRTGYGAESEKKLGELGLSNITACDDIWDAVMLILENRV